VVAVLDSTPRARDRLGLALRWFGLTLVSAPFVLSPFLIVATRLPAWWLSELSIEWFILTRILMGLLASLPFFLLVPWFTARLPWFDRSVPGVLALSILLAIPAALTLLVFLRAIVPIEPVWVIALGSIAVPRLISKSLRPGAFSLTPP
jgi:hypothetical protein